MICKSRLRCLMSFILTATIPCTTLQLLHAQIMFPLARSIAPTYIPIIFEAPSAFSHVDRAIENPPSPSVLHIPNEVRRIAHSPQPLAHRIRRRVLPLPDHSHRPLHVTNRTDITLGEIFAHERPGARQYRLPNPRYQTPSLVLVHKLCMARWRRE